MKIAQMTKNSYHNHGMTLQKYALHKTLQKYADFVEVLWYDSNSFLPDTGVWLGWNHQCDQNNPQKNFMYEAIRSSKFRDFEFRYIRTRFNIPYIEEIADDYDFFVIGSDQVWNPLSGIGFLEFVPREKRISYAASISSPIIPDEMKEYFRRGILGIPHVSIREEGSVKMIEELTGKKPLLVVDPIFLLTLEEWHEVAQRPIWFDEKYERGYVLSYCLRGEPPQALYTVAKESNLKVVELLKMDNYNHYTVGPAEFLYLVEHASLVYTNSFHGTAFSIFFRTPFVSYEYHDENVFNKSLRIPGILKMFDLENRLAKPENNYKINSPLETDFSFRDKILPKERAKSFGFLANALGTTVSVKWGGVG
ncbi:MAG: polysaccharide pyruvyl transferase family protein [Selenomonadaceae bacterium]|nr:polysaccharide pyruvyl transferase family protein [Selenomonadaceae bacterium]